MSLLQSPLRPLAERCVELADRQGRTPVIAVQRELTLAPAFYAALASELRTAARRSLRLEILVDLERTFSPWRTRSTTRRAEGIRRVLSAEFADSVAVETRTVLSRPAGPERPLVVGLAGTGDSVPGWAAMLRLTCRPLATDDFHLIPSAA